MYLFSNPANAKCGSSDGGQKMYGDYSVRCIPAIVSASVGEIKRKEEKGSFPAYK